MPTLRHLATMQPSCTSRTWSSAPHPHLPILATACSDKTARIYSLQTFTQQSVVSGGHKRSIRRCAWKPDSKGESVLATGSFDASVGIWRRWEAGAGEPRELDMTRHHHVNGNSYDDDDDDEWRFAVILDGHDSEVKSLAFCPSAPLLATCSRDKSVWVWEELDDDNFETVAVLQEHEGDVKTVAWHPVEPLLASGSYDDEIRLWREDVDDWACCARLTGHQGTVWWLEFEDANNIYALSGDTPPGEEETAVETGSSLNEEQQKYVHLRLQAGPRLMSCSDDATIRVWRRVPKEGAASKASTASSGPAMPSIWKNDIEEQWIEETQLPIAHERPIYSVSWSRTTGRVVSAGSDGKLVVYAEAWTDGSVGKTSDDNHSTSPTQWTVVAEIDNAHDVFEINHVVWAPRADKEKCTPNEEVIVTTGDNGEVKVWVLDP